MAEQPTKADLEQRIAELEKERELVRGAKVTLTAEETIDRDAKVKQAVTYAAIAAGAIAFFLFGASTPFLIALELFLVWKIAEYHRFIMTPGDIFQLKGMFVILGGFVAAHIARFFVHFIPGANIAVASGFVFLIGKYVPTYLEQQQQLRNETGWKPPEGGSAGCFAYGLIGAVVIVGVLGALLTCVGIVFAALLSGI